MNWFSTVVLRLFIGSTVGFTITLLFSYYQLGSGGEATNNIAIWLVLIAPIVLIIIAGFLIPNWILNQRWKDKWIPLAEGKVKSSPEKMHKSIKRAMRELTGVWYLPNKSQKRTSEFIDQLAKTLVNLRYRQDWAWEIYALAWFKISDDLDTVESIRNLLIDSEELGNDAYEVGLKLLSERDSDLELAILLSREGLIRDFSELDPKRLPLLENAWLAAYAKEEKLSALLRPRLMGLFYETKRRDDVSGRIYLDAFIDGTRTARLLEEMNKVADVLARTGRSPEMTANLRALSKSALNGDEANHSAELVSWRAPIALTKEEKETVKSVRQIVEDSVEVKEGQKKRSTEFSMGKGIKAEKRKKAVKEKKKSPMAPILIGSFVALSIAFSAYYFLVLRTDIAPAMQSSTNKQAGVLSGPGEVRSQLPFTIQIAALPTRESAVKSLNRLREKGLDAYFVITKRGEVEWFRIRFGKYETTRDAQAVADSLRNLGTIEEYYVATFEPGEIPRDIKK